MKVLHIVTLSEMGGAQRVVHQLATRVDRKRFDVTVACGTGGDLVAWLRRDGIRVIELPEMRRAVSPFWDLMVLFRLWWIIRKENYDLVHCHSTKAGVIGRIAARLAGVKKIVFTAHGWSVREDDHWLLRVAYGFVEWMMSHLTTTLVCVCNHDAQLTSKWRLRTQVEVIYNGVELNPTVSDTKQVQASAPLVVGFVGRLAYPKDPLRFVNAAAAYRDKYGSSVPVKFQIIGDGPLLDQVKDLVAARKLGTTVEILGKRDDAVNLMKDMAVVCLLTRREGLPLVVLESLSVGTPVVASAVGGISEVVQHNSCGLLVDDTAGPEEIAEAIHLLCSQPSRLQLMGKQGIARVRRHFSISHMVKSYERVYLQ